jgi:hypothetical protein
MLRYVGMGHAICREDIAFLEMYIYHILPPNLIEKYILA